MAETAAGGLISRQSVREAVRKTLFSKSYLGDRLDPSVMVDIEHVRRRPLEVKL